MFDFNTYRWYHWLLLTAFVISLYWLWALYLLLALLWLGAVGPDSSSTRKGRPRSTVYRPTPWRPRSYKSARVKSCRAPRVRKPKIYKGRTLKSGVRSTYDPVFKRWRNQARDSTWRPPLD